MTWTVSVIFDHMEVIRKKEFETQKEAVECLANWSHEFQGRGLYQVKMEKVE